MTEQQTLERVCSHLFTQRVASFGFLPGADPERYKALMAEGTEEAEDKASLMQTCLYRGPDNTMCAVGCLIPDPLYRPESMEGRSASYVIDEIVKRHGEREQLLLGWPRYTALITQLQCVHDEYMPRADDDPGNGVRSLTQAAIGMQSVAEKFGLTLPAIVIEHLPPKP